MSINKIPVSSIKGRLEAAIQKLYSNDLHLIKEGLNERSITHKLAMYLSSAFKNFHVDHEYNGDVHNADNYRKVVDWSNFEELYHELVNTEQAKYLGRVVSIFPDIIVHERGTHDNNLLIVEVKKSLNSERDDKFSRFDQNKLKACVHSRVSGGFGYKLGAFIQFITPIIKTHPECHITYFSEHNGVIMQDSILLSITLLNN